MAAGLSTPLHLAASLLAVFTAAGLAMVVMSRPASWSPGHRQPLSDLAAAVGAVVIAVGHGLSGALADGGSEAVGTLRAVGLALLALGLSPSRLVQLTGPPVLV
ncbi:MAG: hypothetical protein M3276_02075, partial [Actinomycetota bacterium]|nr:hypothetical protein [Actinomycetota bacterium]